MKRIIALTLLVAIIVLLFSGCEPDWNKYYGPNPECFSIAAYSLLGVSGHVSDKVEILETDTQGRVMFAFLQESYQVSSSSPNYICAIMICQKTEGAYTYFYSIVHCVLAFRQSDISEAEIMTLKEQNDWDKELDDGKMTKVRIVRKKPNSPYFSLKDVKLFNEIFDINSETGYKVKLGVDKNERGLYLVWTKETEGSFKGAYMVILNADLSYGDPDVCLEEIEDIWNYQEQLSAFKERNSWELFVE